MFWHIKGTGGILNRPPRGSANKHTHRHTHTHRQRRTRFCGVQETLGQKCLSVTKEKRKTRGGLNAIVDVELEGFAMKEQRRGDTGGV